MKDITPPPILTPELADRVNGLLNDWLRNLTATSDPAQDFARMARELGIGIVDIARNRAWVDERVHEGALHRARLANERADEAERELAEFQGMEGR